MSYRELVLARRAVDFFDPARKVDSTLLRRVIETAARAPSSFNLQPWQLMVLTEAEDKTRLRKLAMDQPKVSEAPVVLMVLADREGWREGNPTFERTFAEMVKTGLPEEKRGWFAGACKQLYGRNQEAFQAFACKNAGFFAMNLMLAAQDSGLNTHPMDGFEHDAVREAFNIPERYWIPLLIAVGYFDESKELAPVKWRKSFEDIIVRF